ncbi:hypothetical protein RugamoR57_30990 [Duganella caerulea]|uniref:hypothetical protein n=1 Tax=Duganella caerulea TaxID=2885762 RepID=UPI0030E7CC06
MSQQAPDQHSILDDAWGQVVGGMDWLKSVLFGEFSDHRPLSAVVADMLVSFIPGVVIVTSARDAVAVILRLANHPEKREELMEWVLLSACLIVIALPVAMAAGGAVAAGVGAIVGGIAGSELGAALRAVMLMLIKEASKLVELVRFLQKFIKGDILKFLRAIQFAKYEKPLMQAMSKITGKLVDMVKALRTHLESLRYFDSVKATIAKLAAWEHKFYAVQQDALRNMPKALAELDARLAKVLAQTAPKEAHTVAAGVQADKKVAELPVRQRVRDTPGKVMPKSKGEAKAPAARAKPDAAKPKAKAIDPPKTAADVPLKDAPVPAKPPDNGVNTKRQAVADAAVAADRERITQLSKESRDAEKNGDMVLAEAKLDEAREILKPHFPTKAGDTWDEVIKRLDVSSPKDGAVFWSGTGWQAKQLGHPDAARAFAEKIGGVTLETTSGGRIIDGWPDINNLPWDASKGPPPFSGPLWQGVSEKYAEGTSGIVNVVQTPNKLWDPLTVWHNQEKPLLLDRLEQGKISDIQLHVVDLSSAPHQLSPNYIDQLLKFDQRP